MRRYEQLCNHIQQVVCAAIEELGLRYIGTAEQDVMVFSCVDGAKSLFNKDLAATLTPRLRHCGCYLIPPNWDQRERWNGLDGEMRMWGKPLGTLTVSNHTHEGELLFVTVRFISESITTIRL